MNPEAVDHRWQLRRRIDAQTVHVLALQGHIIVDEARREKLPGLPQRRRQLPTGIASAVNEYLPAAKYPAHRQPQQPTGSKARAGDQHCGNQAVKQWYRPRHPLLSGHSRHEGKDCP